MTRRKIQKAIPTNVITGFLGVGKTTVIQHLLKQKPEHERWAVLVNEFGEVGIDSEFFGGKAANDTGVTISQVPGGCMCCTNGLPMQIALNLLLAKSNPHRLLIEPTGLGHPREVLAVLSGEFYREALSLQATFALVDARKVSDERYTSNRTFNDQLSVAEVIIANKSDLYQPQDFPALLDYIDDQFGLGKKPVYQVRQGEVEIDWLSQSTCPDNKSSYQNLAPPQPDASAIPELQSPREGFVCADNKGEGFFSRGWIFNPHWQFEEAKLRSLFHGVDAERLKGVFITDKGVIAFNKVDNTLSQFHLDDTMDSRVEIISHSQAHLDGLELALLDCLLIPGDFSQLQGGSGRGRQI